MLSPSVPYNTLNPSIGDTTPNVMNMPMPYDMAGMSQRSMRGVNDSPYFTPAQNRKMEFTPYNRM